jgi:hypothetical protein
VEEVLKSGKRGEYSYKVFLTEFGKLYFTVTAPVGELVESGGVRSLDAAMERVQLACEL